MNIRKIGISTRDNASAIAARELSTMSSDLLRRAYLEINSVSPIVAPRQIDPIEYETTLELLVIAQTEINRQHAM